jgi:hypothetical protein
MATLAGNETLYVVGLSSTGQLSGEQFPCTTQDIANLSGADGGGFVAQNYTASHFFTAEETGTIATNTGATIGVYAFLPDAVINLRYAAYVNAAYQLTLSASGTDVIRNAGNVGAASGTIYASTVGNVVFVQCFVTGVWTVTGIVGTWTIT